MPRGRKAWIVGDDPSDHAELFEQLVDFRKAGFNWKTICDDLLGVREHWLRDWREEHGFNEFMVDEADVTDEELDHIIYNFTADHPQRGESYLWGAVWSIGIHVTRARIRQSIHRVQTEEMIQNR